VDLASIIKLALQVGLVLNVFALGLSASRQDETYVLRRPGLLIRSLLSMNVIMPLLAAAMVAALDLNPAVKVALITLAVSPIPPMLPKKTMRAGGDVSYAIGLLVVAAVLAIVFVPLAVDLIGRVFGGGARMPPAEVAKLVMATILAPLAAGVVVRRAAPRSSERIAQPVAMVSSALLVVSVVPVLYVAMPEVLTLLGNGTLLAITLFVLAGLAVGDLLGGPEPGNRTVLAMVTSSRHPGVAIAIASVNFPGQKSIIAGSCSTCWSTRSSPCHTENGAGAGPMQKPSRAG